MSCIGIAGDYPGLPFLNANSTTWILVEFSNGDAHWTIPCRECCSDLCKRLPIDTHIVGRIETINMRS